MTWLRVVLILSAEPSAEQVRVWQATAATSMGCDLCSTMQLRVCFRRGHVSLMAATSCPVSKNTNKHSMYLAIQPPPYAHRIPTSRHPNVQLSRCVRSSSGQSKGMCSSSDDGNILRESKFIKLLWMGNGSDPS